MATSSRYRMFLKLCDIWPVDASKADHDLGLYIHRRIEKAFREEEASKIDSAECYRIHDSLHRIATDHYRLSYPRRMDNGALGLSLEEYQDTNDSFQNQKKSGLRLSQKIKSLFRYKRSFEH